ncbi:MAG: MFS transporter [Anaerolineaceae bacterium]|nr:MFS transporter [Anaerolineaceae bacterium]
MENPTPARDGIATVSPRIDLAKPNNYTPRNFTLGVVNGVLYSFAETVLDPTLVLVAFLSNLTSSPLLLGAVLPLRDGIWSLPQLWISGYLQNKATKLPLYNRMTLVRAGMWAMLFLSITFVKTPALLLGLFFFLYGVGSLASGVSGLAFLEVVGRTVEPRRRGEFYAWRLGLGGLVGIGGSLLVRFLLDTRSPVQFPYNFSILSGVYFVFGTAALTFYSFVREGQGYQINVKATTRDQLRRVKEVLRCNRYFRSYLAMQSTLMVANAATPFFAVYVTRQMGVAKEMIGVYLAAVTVANLIANLVFGRMSLLYGNRRVMTLAALNGLAMSFLVLLLVLLNPLLHIPPGIAGIWLIPVFILSGFRTTGIGVSGNSLLLDLAPSEERSLYIGFTNTLLGIVLVFTALSGVIYTLFGFTSLLVITAAAHVVALLSAVNLHNFPSRESFPQSEGQSSAE